MLLWLKCNREAPKVSECAILIERRPIVFKTFAIWLEAVHDHSVLVVNENIPLITARRKTLGASTEPRIVVAIEANLCSVSVVREIGQTVAYTVQNSCICGQY